ncbi:MAG: hypothetical protein SFV17_04955 [Candidatus Obscuribacter sp.]|nr:hypothetical protein [Candidatus Obscuribacter sp.]
MIDTGTTKAGVSTLPLSCYWLSPLYLLQVLYWGWLLALWLLADPDSCFLVGSGRLILERGFTALGGDSFSWTLAQYPPGDFVLYQWLASVIFAQTMALAGSIGLIVFGSCLALFSFVFLPQLVVLVSGRTYTFLGITLAAVAAFNAAVFHLYLRPELFSFLLMSILLAAFSLSVAPQTRLPAGVDGLASGRMRTLIFLGTMLFFSLWANLHTGFVLGLFLLLLNLFAHCLVKIRRTDGTSGRQPLLAVLSLLGALLGCCLTPYGIKLFAYLPHLFFSKVNARVVELTPLSLPELFTSDYLPFTGLSLISLSITIWYLLRARIRGQLLGCPAFYTASVFSLTLVGAGLRHRRLVVFAGLILVYYLLLLVLKGSESSEARLPFRWHKAAICFFALPLLAMVGGASLSARTFAVSLPAQTVGFFPPFAAIDFIAAQRPAGRLLNDAQYGDVMIERLGPRAQVFIDTRFDVYGDQLVLDYDKMANGQDNWQELLKKYKIDWVFFFEQYRIVRLLRELGWQEVFCKDGAVILKRPE